MPSQKDGVYYNLPPFYFFASIIALSGFLGFFLEEIMNWGEVWAWVVAFCVAVTIVTWVALNTLLDAANDRLQDETNEQ